MRRSILIAVCGAVAWASALPGAAAAASVKTPAVKLLACTPDEHSAVFQGRMVSVPATDRMAMRYSLLSQTGAKAEVRLKVPGLSRWRRSKLGVSVYAWKQEVLNLAVGAAYRVQVDFRWFDADGVVIRTARRRSTQCSQFSHLPNLRIQLVGSAPTATAGSVRYRVRVDNDGGVAASGASVQLAVDGGVAETKPLETLAPGDWRVLGLIGPACVRWVEATADPANAVTEVTESDNLHSLACADLARR